MQPIDFTNTRLYRNMGTDSMKDRLNKSLGSVIGFSQASENVPKSKN